MEPELTSFQMTAESRILDLLGSVGRPVRERKAMRGQMPHMRMPETALKLVADGVEIWLYEDEATFSTATQDERFEREDYEDETALLGAFIRQLSRTLASDALWSCPESVDTS